jgi:hypothetical protein
MERLTYEERMVIEHRFGFNAPPMGFRELAEKMNLAQSKVQSLQKSALAKLELALEEPDTMSFGFGSKENGGHDAAERERRASSTHVQRRRSLSPTPDFFGLDMPFGRCDIQDEEEEVAC